MKKPKVTVIIVNYNGKRWLGDCLKSLFEQSFKNFEVILVDNNSTDDSVLFTKKYFQKVKIVQLNSNTGFAGGNNAGYKEAKGEFILFVNNDTKVEKRYLENFLAAFENNPSASIIQSKIVWMDDVNKIDSCGSYWTDSSFLYYFGNSKDCNAPKYNKSFPVFFSKRCFSNGKKRGYRKDRNFF